MFTRDTHPSLAKEKNENTQRSNEKSESFLLEEEAKLIQTSLLDRETGGCGGVS